MKRWTFTILLFLLLVSGGAIVNVAVAWGLAVFSGGNAERWVASDLIDLGFEERTIPGDVRRAHEKRLPKDATRIGERREGSPDFGWDLFSITTAFEVTETGDPYCSVTTNALCVGWPFLSMWAHHTMTYTLGIEPPAPCGAEPSTSGVLIRLGEDHIPYLLRWPGFAVNTLIYAIILWLLIPGPFVLRRRIRVKRGRCPKCGYDLRGKHDAGCPECGWNRASEHAAGGDAV